MRGAVSTALLGAGFIVAAGLLDAEPFYVPGVAFVFLGVLCPAWVALASRGVRVQRTIGARRVIEDQPLGVRIQARAGGLPFPAGAVDEPLLDVPVPLPSGRQRFSFRIEAAFARRGRRVLEPPRVIVRDPLGLEHAADGEDRREQSRHEQADGNGHPNDGAETASVAVTHGNLLDVLFG